MTLQQPPQLRAEKIQLKKSIFCHKCGNPIIFDKDHVAPSGRKIPLEPNTNSEPHVNFCMYATMKDNPHTESLFIDFLSLASNKRQRRIIGAVGKAK